MQSTTGTLLGVRWGIEGTQSSYLGCIQRTAQQQRSRCENKFVLLFIYFMLFFFFFLVQLLLPAHTPEIAAESFQATHAYENSFFWVTSHAFLFAWFSFYSFYSLISLPFSFEFAHSSYSCKDVKYLMRKPTQETQRGKKEMEL